MDDFFRFDGNYTRTPEGWGSWQQLLMVTSFVVAMVFFAVYFGMRYRHEEEAKKLFVLKVTAIVIDVVELIRIVALVFGGGNGPEALLYYLPLFLCSFQFISIPIAAFGKGKIREAATDFLFLFGILGAIAGTYGAGQNYGAYPVWSFHNVFSTITHTMSGFAGLYVAIVGLLTLKVKNIKWVVAILFGFAIVAYIADIAIDYNYMFLMRGDGTPYDIFYDLVHGNRILYPLTVMFLFILYMGAVYGTAYAIPSFRKQAFEREPATEAN